MRFHLTSDQLAIQDSLSRALDDALPRDQLMDFLDSEDDYHGSSWTAMMELGLGGLMIGEDAGGSGLGLVEAALAIEAMGKGAMPGPVIGHLVTVLALKLSGNEEVKAKFLDPLIDGSCIASLAFGGDELPTQWSPAIKQGKLSGTVDHVVAANQAGLFLVGIDGGGLALVETGDGVSVSKRPSTDRTRPSGSITFETAPCHLIAEPGDALVQRVFDAALILLSADALGGAQYCLDVSVSYAQEREQFGQPISKFQALKHQLATMALSVEPSRSLLWYAAYAWDNELPDATRSAALAKAHICDQFVQVARDAIAAHGGIGYTWEYGLNIWFRRSVFDRIMLGSPAQHRAKAADLAEWCT